MTPATVIATGASSPAADLPALLCAAASGDRSAFARFVDATMREVLRLELARAVAGRVPASRTRQVAEAAARRRYLEAWTRAADQATSDLSPRAWLLALATGDRAA